MRLAEIEARMAEIKADIEKRGGEMNAEQLAALEAEVNSLKEERAALLAANEKRSSLLLSIADGQESAKTARSFPSPAEPDKNEQRTVSDPLDTVEYRRAFMSHVLTGEPISAEFRAGAVTATTDVGAIIPTTVLNTIVEKIESVGMILSRVTRTAYKGGLAIPTSTVKPVATWVTQGTGSDKQKKTVGTITFAYHKLRCAVAVTLETDTMALSAFESNFTRNVVEAMTKALEQAIISGDGTGKPKGILAETPAVTISAVAPSYAALIDAEAALPLAYENGAAWCMSKQTFMKFYGLTDETERPIGTVTYGLAGKPERTLLGRPVVVCDYVDSYTESLATGKVFAFLFRFEDYILNTNYSMGVKKYEDNETDDIVTKAVMLADGKVMDKNSLVAIKKASA